MSETARLHVTVNDEYTHTYPATSSGSVVVDGSDVAAASHAAPAVDSVNARSSPSALAPTATDVEERTPGMEGDEPSAADVLATTDYRCPTGCPAKKKSLVCRECVKWWCGPVGGGYRKVS